MNEKLTQQWSSLLWTLLLLVGTTQYAMASGSPDYTPCNTAPVIVCPSNHFACPGTSIDPSVTGYATASPGDENCQDPEVRYEDEIISTGPCDGAVEIHRTWIAEYPDNSDPWLTAECTQLIKLKDLEAPEIWECPTDIILDLADGCDGIVTWTEPNVTDNCLLDNVSSTHDSGDIFPEGTTVVIYTATDACGNVSTCSFTVTVVGSCCTEAGLTIVCPEHIEACPGGSTDPDITGYATAYFDDPDCPEPIITYSEIILSEGPCVGAIKVWRSWRAEHPDDPSIHASCNQIIEYRDITAPTITECPADITIEMSSDCQAIANWEDPIVSDNCGIEWVMSNYDSGDAFPQGETEVIYTATDFCGNETTCAFTVTVNGDCCIDAPLIDCPSDFLGCPGESLSPNHTGVATAETSDPSCGEPFINFTDQILSTGPCDNAVKLIRTWRAANPDRPESYSECEQVIILVDKTNPVIISCPEDILIETNEEHVSVSWDLPVATDNCSTVGFISNHNPGDLFTEGTTQVTYIAHDACGNRDTCEFYVTVLVEDNGTLVCPDNIIVECTGPNGAFVYWNEPTLETTCDINCNGNAGEIPGYLFMGTLNGSSYYCSMSNATWTDAQSIAESYGGYLAVINTEEENNFLASFLVTQSAFIGLSDRDWESEFNWVNGDPISYQNWYPGQPNDYGVGQDCVELLYTGQWNDQYCHKSQEYIMEIPCVGEEIIQESGPSNGSNFPVGTTTITYSGTDGCGAHFTCSFTVTVESSAHLICPDDIYISCSSGQNSTVVNWSLPELESCCTVANAECADSIDGFLYMGSLNGKSYYCSRFLADWETAEEFCATAGGELAVVNSADENTFLASFLTTQAAWIGLHDKTTEGIFEWVDGSGLTYQNWYPGQPNDYGIGQDCIEMLSNGLWNDQYCHKALEFIMEIECSNAGIYQLSGPPPGSQFLIGTTTVSYYGVDGCGNKDTCSFDVHVDRDDLCESYGNNSHYLWIDEVRFGENISWTGNNGGYADFSDDCLKYTPGESFKLMLIPGFASASYTAYWNIWIDWNEDGDFYDSGEFMAYGSGSGALWGTFTIPISAPTGNKKVRVSMKYGSYPDDPCAIFKYGEVEDYCFTIVNGAQTGETSGFAHLETLNLGEEKFASKNAIEQQIRIDTRVLDAPVIEKAETIEKEIEQISLYPNPTSDYVIISSTDKEAILSIYGPDGIVAMNNRIQFTNGKAKVNVQGLTAGIYYVLVGESAVAQKLIIR